MALALIALICFVSLGALSIDVDDQNSFRVNELIGEDFAHFFTSGAQVDGRPLAIFATWLGYEIWGNDPGWFHYLSVVVHLFASMVLALLCRQMGVGWGTSLLGGLFFLVNVSHFQAIHWLSALDYPLYMLFGSLSLICYFRYVILGHLGWLVAGLASFLLALLSHIAALFFWVFALYWTASRDRRIPVRILLVSMVVLAPMAVAILNITPSQADTWRAIDYFSEDLFNMLFSMGRNYLLFVSRLFTMAYWAPFPFYLQHAWEFWLGAVALVALLALPLVTKSKTTLDWTLWVLISLAPFTPLMLDPEVSLQLPQGPSRHLYIASAGIAVLTAWLLVWCGTRLGGRRLLFYGVGVGLLLISSYIGLKRVEALSYYAAGSCATIERPEVSLDQFRRAIDLSPATIPLQKAYLRLATAKLDLGEDPLPVLVEAEMVFPNDIWITSFMAAVQTLDADEEVAYQASRRLVGLGGQANEANLGALFVRNTSTAYNHLARYFIQRGDLELSLISFERAFELNPEQFVQESSRLSQIYLQRADLLQGQQELAGALRAYRMALQFDASNNNARINYGWLLYRQRQWSEAISEFETVLTHGPNIHAQFNLALACVAMGDRGRADEIYADAIAAFGVQEAVRIGAVDDLHALVERDSSLVGLLGMFATEQAVGAPTP
jgi:tetratricopeptide (TPR) repeat protein